MALTAFCTVCQRTVYVDDDATPVCPVCSSPLLETAGIGLDAEGGGNGQDEDKSDGEK
jgi:hypothetical protein